MVARMFTEVTSCLAVGIQVTDPDGLASMQAGVFSAVLIATEASW